MSAALQYEPIDYASDEERKANKKAIKRRNLWRIDYSVLSRQIRDMKRSCASTRRYNSFRSDSDNTQKVDRLLRILQNKAAEMMVEQEEIKQALRTTAYPWV